MSLNVRRKMSKRTLCEVLREVDDLAYESGMEGYEELRAKLVEAEQMGKRMSKKLYTYNKKWQAGWWESNPDYEEKYLRRLERQALRKR
jgi:hypothetical protein